MKHFITIISKKGKLEIVNHGAITDEAVPNFAEKVSCTNYLIAQCEDIFVLVFPGDSKAGWDALSHNVVEQEEPYRIFRPHVTVEMRDR